MCMYIVKIQIHKYNDKYKSAGTVHVRRCAHHMASPPFALHKRKKTFDSFEVSENILQKDSSPHAREGRWNFFGGAPLFFCVCSQFITVISSLQPTGQNALDQNNLQCGRSSFERKTSWLSKICKLRPLLSRSFEHESHIVAVSNFIILGFVLWPSHHQGNSGLCSIRPSGSLFRLLSYPPLTRYDPLAYFDED